MRSALLLSLLLAGSPAAALPRFAIRTGLPCSACHVNPTGGGMRSAFGRNVFARQWLVQRSSLEAAFAPPSVEIGEHVAVGGDLRSGYLWFGSAQPEFQDTSSLYLMEANFYTHIETGPRLAWYLSLGAYGGFEAFALVRPLGPQGERDFTIKAGRFVLPFGLRDDNHTAYTREGIGMGPTDRDNAIELGLTIRRSSVFLAISDGTYGDAFLDSGGSKNPAPYDKAVTLRLMHQPQIGPLRVLLAGSVMYNANVGQQNPLFVPALFVGSQTERIKEGVDELRLEAAGGLALGRLAYRGEVVVVHDEFADSLVRALTGYVSYQELSAVFMQGVEALVSYEFADNDVDFDRGRIERVGGGVNWFAMPSLELSAVVRHQFGPADYLIGARDDVIVMLHLFL